MQCPRYRAPRPRTIWIMPYYLVSSLRSRSIESIRVYIIEPPIILLICAPIGSVSSWSNKDARVVHCARPPVCWILIPNVWCLVCVVNPGMHMPSSSAWILPNSSQYPTTDAIKTPSQQSRVKTSPHYSFTRYKHTQFVTVAHVVSCKKEIEILNLPATPPKLNPCKNDVASVNIKGKGGEAPCR